MSLVGCGEVKQNAVDAPPAGDAPPVDAPIDAPPPPAPVESALVFPGPNTVIRDFTAAEMSSQGVTSTSISATSGSLTGNAAAPMTSPFASVSTMVTFTFSTPITAAGLSVADIDFGNDNALTIRVVGLAADGTTEVVAHQRILAAANTAEEENNGAIFVGWKNAVDVKSVRMTISSQNSTAFDNLMFK